MERERKCRGVRCPVRKQCRHYGAGTGKTDRTPVMASCSGQRMFEHVESREVPMP